MEITQMALELLQVDKLGLDHIDHKLLLGIIEKFRGGQCWIRNGFSNNWRRISYD